MRSADLVVTVSSIAYFICQLLTVVACPLNLHSVMCVVFLSGVVIFKSITNDLGGPVDSPSNPVQWWPADFGGLLTAVSIAGLTFSCHFNILPMHGELRYQTRANKRIILYTAMAITYVLNVFVSFFGFFQVSRLVLYSEKNIHVSNQIKVE